MTLFLSDADVVELFSPGKCVEAVRSVYADLGKQKAATWVRRDLIFPTDREDVAYRFVTMEGGSVGLGVVAQRSDSENVALRVKDGILRQEEIPVTPYGKYVGLIYLYSIKTGELLAILNDGEIGRIRVSATCAVGADYLSRKDSSTVGLFGAGWQAGTQIPALAATRDIKKVNVYSPTPSRRREFCSEMSRKMGIDFFPVDEPKQAVTGADIIVASSSSRQAVCNGDWIAKGTHLGCIVQYEFDDATWKKADVLVASQLGRGEAKVVGGMDRFAETVRHEPYQQYVNRMRMLSDVVNGKSPGRENDEQITLFYKGLGLGIEFAAAAKAVYDEAIRTSRGKEIMPTAMFTQDSHT
ncbi:MAG TPA: ornithine cyclodeaminase family protein [Nitrososphaerales archaeon]|nr:ornithine cyclodeaminase family protein [Nitrososphaerales archaeon]